MLRAAIIGLGVGDAHIKAYSSHPQCEVRMLCDLDPERLRLGKSKYAHVEVSERAEEVLQNPDIDIVSIASFDQFHCQQIIAALEHDKHVFVEKPFCLSEEEAIAIKAALAKKPHLKLSSNLILRKSPRFMHLKELVDEGKFGEIYYSEGDYNYGRIQKLTESWRGEEPFYSVMYGGGIHVIDLLLWFNGCRVESVSAVGNKICTAGTKFRFNDMVVAVLKFENGAVAKVSANFGCVRPHFHGLAVYGTKATFINEVGPAQLYTARDEKTLPTKLDTPYPGVEKGALLEEFVNEIIDGKPSAITTQDVFDGMAVCFAIEKAVSEQRVVAVNYI